jgi:hypothetical protein
VKCKKCGGTIHDGTCKICEMLAEQAPPGGTCTGWPLESMSMAVHSEQAQEANQFLADNGISSREAYHKPDGKLVLESATARKKVMKAKGLTDLSAFN